MARHRRLAVDAKADPDTFRGHPQIGRSGAQEALTEAPHRVQRKRVRGWQKPPNTICVNRGTPYGNLFVVRPDKEAGTKLGLSDYICVPTVDDAIACYREFIEQRPEFRTQIVERLRGKNLACFCALDHACHADVLIEVANRITG